MQGPPERQGIPEGLWLRCPNPECGDMLFRRVVEESLHVCPGCQYHFRISARTRIAHVRDGLRSILKVLSSAPGTVMRS